MLSTLYQTAEYILAQEPDPVVRFRLLRDVLGRPPDGQEIAQARENLADSVRVQELQQEQWDDGSWGRLHSKDYSAHQKIPTTEMGVERALALGLDGRHPVLRKARQHLAALLEGQAEPRDRAERNDRWPTGVQLFAASTLAQIQPDLLILDDVWELWAEIARRTFASGSYDPDAETRAHRALTGASVRNSYLVIDNKYTLALLGSRARSLPRDLERALLNWVWHREDGIRYLNESMSFPPRQMKPGPLERWFRSLELLSRFPSWPALFENMNQWLWEKQAPHGLWDFGPRPAASVTLPYSASWRKKSTRQFDWTTRVLVLLRRYHTTANHWAHVLRSGSRS